MKREYNVQVTTGTRARESVDKTKRAACVNALGTPKVNYREVITKRVDFEYVHKRQTGGRGEWAKICGYYEPIDPTRQTLVSLNIPAHPTARKAHDLVLISVCNSHQRNSSLVFSEQAFLRNISTLLKKDFSNLSRLYVRLCGKS